MIILTNCLGEKTDEGALKLANSLVKRIKSKFPETTILSYGQGAEFSDIHIDINKFFISRKLFKFLSPTNEAVLYIPFPAKPISMAIRIFNLAFFTRKKINVLLTMKLKTNLIVKLLLKRSKVNFIVLSKESQNHYSSFIDKKRILYLKSGVDTEKFVPAKADEQENLKNKYGFNRQDKVILHVGHLKNGRNIDKLINIFQKQKILLVISSFAKEEIDIDLKNKLLNCPNITVIDEYIPNIEEIYKLSDLYFFPVIKEGNCIDVPLSCLEAAACNKPILTTDFGEMKEFKGKSGFFFIDSFEKDALNSKIDNILSCCEFDTRSQVLEYDFNSSVKKALEFLRE